jgi:hypothetical protein
MYDFLDESLPEEEAAAKTRAGRKPGSSKNKGNAPNATMAVEGEDISSVAVGKINPRFAPRLKSRLNRL